MTFPLLSAAHADEACRLVTEFLDRGTPAALVDPGERALPLGRAVLRSVGIEVRAAGRAAKRRRVASSSAPFTRGSPTSIAALISRAPSEMSSSGVGTRCCFVTFARNGARFTIARSSQNGFIARLKTLHASSWPLVTQRGADDARERKAPLVDRRARSPAAKPPVKTHFRMPWLIKPSDDRT